MSQRLVPGLRVGQADIAQEPVIEPQQRIALRTADRPRVDHSCDGFDRCDRAQEPREGEERSIKGHDAPPKVLC